MDFKEPVYWKYFHFILGSSKLDLFFKTHSEIIFKVYSNSKIFIYNKLIR